MLKNCSFCGHKVLKNKNVQYIYQHNDHFLLVKDVPCEECEYCGEQYFAATVLKKIEKSFFDILSKKKKAKSNLTMPVWQFAAV